MSNYLNNIVARSLNIADVVQPRVPQLFEQSSALVPEPPDSSVQTEMRPNTPAIISEASETPGMRTDHAESEVRPLGFEPGKPAPAALHTHVKNPHRVSPAVQPIRPLEAVKESLARTTVNPAASALDSRSMGEPGAPPSNQNAYPQAERELPVPSIVGPPWKETSVKTVSEPSITSSPARLQPSVPAAALSSMPQSNRSEQQPPAIRITIGRVDVRAIMPPGPPPAPASVRPKPALSLESYLKQREEGKR